MDFLFLKGVHFTHFRFDEKKIPLFIGLKRECIYKKIKKIKK